tara:strand:+ start:366 stop:524 length:159 start_codon:yes stop_codon:yes gene_type:complete
MIIKDIIESPFTMEVVRKGRLTGNSLVEFIMDRHGMTREEAIKSLADNMEEE